MSEKEYEPSEADRDNKLTSVQVGEHARLCRQLNYTQYLRGVAEGSNSRLRKAIEGAIWLLQSMPLSGNKPENILATVERRLVEAMKLDAQIQEQEGLTLKEQKALE